MRCVLGTIDPAALAVLVLAAGLYGRAVRLLRRRGYVVGAGQLIAWYAGLGLVCIALMGPIDALSEELLSAHMAQHLLIADLAAPLLLVGLRTPLLVFLLPRPLLVAVARRRRLRTVLRSLRRPLLAIPLYVLMLYGWHIAFMFEAAMRSDALHALQHQSFVVGSLLVWWSAIEPKRREMPGELWKIAHIGGARLAGMFLGMALIASRSPLYASVYDGSRGLSALHDQQLAGAMMMGLDLLVMLFAVGFFFWRAGRDHDRAESAAAPRFEQAARG